MESPNKLNILKEESQIETRVGEGFQIYVHFISFQLFYDLIYVLNTYGFKVIDWIMKGVLS